MKTIGLITQDKALSVRIGAAVSFSTVQEFLRSPLIDSLYALIVDIRFNGARATRELVTALHVKACDYPLLFLARNNGHNESLAGNVRVVLDGGDEEELDEQLAAARLSARHMRPTQRLSSAMLLNYALAR